MLYPNKCSDCGGEVIPTAEPGRTAAWKDEEYPLPDDLEIPTCNKCGEQYWDGELIMKVENILNELVKEKECLL